MKRLLLVVLTLMVIGAPALGFAPAAAHHAPGHSGGPPEDPGYPGSTAPGRNPTRERESVTMSPGERRDLESCGFQAGSTATVTFNGDAAGTGSAGDDGCIITPVEVLASSRQSAAAGGGLRGSGALFAAVRVRPMVLAQSNSECGRIRVNGVEFPTRSGGNEATLEGTGANGAARTFIHDINLECSRAGSPAGGTLPRTGLSILRWSLVGGLLVAVGAIAVSMERRRLTRRLVS